MKNLRTVTPCFLAMLLPGILSAGSSQINSVADDPQLRRLNQPTASQVTAEDQGQVYIYDGLREAQVNNALNAQFDRMDKMMFVRTISITPEGIEETSDDCDD